METGGIDQNFETPAGYFFDSVQKTRSSRGFSSFLDATRCQREEEEFLGSGDMLYKYTRGSQHPRRFILIAARTVSTQQVCFPDCVSWCWTT